MKELLPNDQDFSEWKVIYPLYLNSSRTKSSGRLASSINCVECPTVAEIAEACIQLGIPCKVEGKKHPKDYQSLGRVRFKLFDGSGRAFNDNVLTKKALTNQIGSVILELKGRQKTSSTKDHNHLKCVRTDSDEILDVDNNGTTDVVHSVIPGDENTHSIDTKGNSKKK
ncbi:signal recognition particle SPR19 [Cryptosporidium canis]|uniref:Signal recognition particle SPR19 n=1 Tax=Cryptosporidium canis TaxID=195482 RepID=A0A9D5HYI3_9CRYT|nr:signal recognition particle SPR19 [Cryptosporidium canis]